MAKILTVSDISLPFTAPEEEALTAAAKVFGLSGDTEYYVAKKALDARKKHDIRFVYTVKANAPKGYTQPENKKVKVTEIQKLETNAGAVTMSTRPVIVGFGPAGMFAGLILARQGLRPLILEKGADVDTRIKDVDAFWKDGRFNPSSNVQFGEGGAGTFSDGKLTTRISDSRCGYVLEEFCRHGAPAEIMYRAKPHVGTDKLRTIVKSIREEIISLGGEVSFNTSLTGIKTVGGKLVSVITDKGDIPAEILILAPGHSARGLFSMLVEKGVELMPKPFSVGVRIEHLQSDIDKVLYGDLAGHELLPKGEYQLSHRQGDRAVYTFCMCPGGVVVPSSSENGGVVTNGMSWFARDGKNANSALVVSVTEKDFAPGPLGGVAFQQELEQKAYNMGRGFAAPVQTVGSFLKDEKGFAFGRVRPSYARGFADGGLTGFFPKPMEDKLKEGINVFGRKLSGFNSSDAVLTGPETRTSSPVKITRDESMQSVSVKGIYPCGEGAGYAGGIVSAAVDGIKAAMAVIGQ